MTASEAPLYCGAFFEKADILGKAIFELYASSLNRRGWRFKNWRPCQFLNFEFVWKRLKIRFEFWDAFNLSFGLCPKLIAQNFLHIFVRGGNDAVQKLATFFKNYIFEKLESQFTIINYEDIVNWLASVPIFELRVCMKASQNTLWILRRFQPKFWA